MPILSRRDFVKTAGTLAAIPFVGPALASRIRFGYAAITWNGKDDQAIADIEALGFPGIQLRSGILPGYQSRPGELRDLLAKHHLTFAVLSSGDVSVDPARRQATIDDHVSHARFLRDAGGLYLQLIDERPKDRAVTPDDIARLGDILTEIGRRATELGVRAAYHPHMGTIGETPDTIDRVLAATDPRHVSLLLDVAHYQQGGGDPVAAIRRYRDRLLVLHIKDVESPRPDGTPSSYRFVELGKGRVDLTSVFRALDEISFDGWAVVELDSVPADRSPRDAGAANREFLESLGLSVRRDR